MSAIFVEIENQGLRRKSLHISREVFPLIEFGLLKTRVLVLSPSSSENFLDSSLDKCSNG
jgi:hypothetical protein